LISKVNKLLEGCDACSGVIIYHSLDGGFGGGFTSRLLEKLKDDIGKVTKTTISIMPSKYSYSNVAYYNTILTLPKI
jgi:tubulin alpha